MDAWACCAGFFFDRECSDLASLVVWEDRESDLGGGPRRMERVAMPLCDDHAAWLMRAAAAADPDQDVGVVPVGELERLQSETPWDLFVVEPDPEHLNGRGG